MELKSKFGNRTFISVLADGKFHQTVPEGTVNSIKREYEDKQGGKHSKVELVFDEASGYISKLSFNENEFGKSLNVEIDGDGTISLNVESNFADDFMKKLPNVDLSQPVTLAPYAFEDDNKRNRRGITIYQGGRKIESAFWDSEKKVVKGDIPQAEGDTKEYDKDDWKMHFMRVRKFLVSNTERIAGNMGTFIKPTTASRPAKPANTSLDNIEYPEEEINPEDIPF